MTIAEAIKIAQDAHRRLNQDPFAKAGPQDRSALHHLRKFDNAGTAPHLRRPVVSAISTLSELM